MARPTRTDYPGALQHVMVRGLERRRLFHDAQDYKSFLDRFSNIIQETDARCYAWVLMPNHVHLLVRTGREKLSKWVQRLLSGYGQYFNLRRRRVGYVYQGRFKSLLCEEDSYFLELVRYIHLNPLKAGLVKNLSKLAKFQWSGHGAILGKKRNRWQSVKEVLVQFGSRRSEARRRYQQFIKEGLKQPLEPGLGGIRLIRNLEAVWSDEDLREPKRRRLGEEVVVGEENFIEDVMKIAQEIEDRRTKLKRRGWTAGRVVARAEAACGVKKGNLRGSRKIRKISRARSLACKWMVEDLGMTTVATAHRLSIMQSAVSHKIPQGRELEKVLGIRLEGKPSRPPG